MEMLPSQSEVVLTALGRDLARDTEPLEHWGLKPRNKRSILIRGRRMRTREVEGGGSFVERATHGTLGRGREDLVRFLDPSV